MCWKRETSQHDHESEQIRSLLRQTSRWAIASQQDRSPMIAVLHANYAVGYLQALQDIFTQRQIQAQLDIPFMDFRKQIYHVQDNATMKVVMNCPSYAEHVDPILAKIGSSSDE